MLRGVVLIAGLLVSAQADEAKPVTATVTVVEDPAATVAFEPDVAVVRRMVERGLNGFAGTTDTTAAWRTWVQAADVVGFKVTSAPGALSGTRLPVVRALVETLLAAGHDRGRVVIWDRRAVDLRAAGWFRLAEELGVRCVAAEDAGWSAAEFYESPILGRLVAGDLEFGRERQEQLGRKSHVTRLLKEELTKVVTVAPVLNHPMTALNGHLAGLALASVDNVLRFESDAAVLAEAVPEICALDSVLPRVVFGVGDGLVCQYRGADRTLLHYATPLNQLRFSRDVVALDALALEDVKRERERVKLAGEKPLKTDLYANAAVLELGVADLKRIEVRRVP